MSESPKHKITAILFADIVGYTSLMQQEEQQALLKLQNFKELLEKKVPVHKGKIIQYYGDGCLVIFENALTALTCAKELQEAFRAKLAIPVRIGLHEGEVVFKDDNVFGHAVNIASRVESMGMAGAILMSSSFRSSVKNNPAFELKWVGRFQLKNVANPMSIYALANKGFPIPKPAEMEGKAINTNQAKTSKKYYFLTWLLPSLLAATLGYFLWKGGQTPEITAQILKERIAVLPFKNNTNDPDLAILGNMAADWINTGLMDVENAEVVSPFTIRTHQTAIGILENDPQNRPSFAQLTGARNLITGNYYKDKDNIIFKLELVDALDGKLHFSFKEVKDKASNKEQLITRLREQVTGYWAARDLVDAHKIAVPNFEAYRLYLEALQKKGTEQELAKILALDSTFYLPRIHFLNIIMGARGGGTKPHLAFLDRHIDELSDYEKAWFIYLKGLYLGQPMTAFKSLNSIRQKYPKDFLLNHSAANIALNGLNNPALALAIYKELPLEEGQAKSAGIYWNERLLNMVTCFIELDKLPEANLLLATTTPNPDIDNNTYVKTRSLEGLTSNNQEKTTQAYELLKATFLTKPFDYFWVNIELLQSNLLSDEFRVQQEADLAKAYQQLAPKNPNRFLWRNFMAIITNKEEMIDQHNMEKLPKGLQIGNIAAVGQFYINRKQSAKVQPIINALQAYTNCDYVGQISTGCGAAYYYIALLQAQIGEQTQAIANLKKAKALGLGNELHRFQYSRYLTALFDLPAFQELIQPIWPSTNEGKVIVKAVNQYVERPDKLENKTAEFLRKQQIKLETNNQFYNFKLGITNNYNNQRINYQYQLANIDTEWLTAEKGEITVGNLPYGKQQLRIKAQFPNGQFAQNILEIPISVPRPFYLNIWFLGVLLTGIFLGFYLWPNKEAKIFNIAE